MTVCMGYYLLNSFLTQIYLCPQVILELVQDLVVGEGGLGT